MTIKKRLFVSNILMTVIPYVLSFAAVLGSIFMIDLLTENETARVALNRWLLLLDNGEHGSYAVLLVLLVLLFFGAVMVITNRLLTSFVFKKIAQPLELLSDRVEHISSGDLDFRINYNDDNEFKKVCEAFNNMAARLKQSIETVQKNEDNRKELIASISHDLRSPLTSIKAFTEGLIDGVAKTPEAQAKYLRTIKHIPTKPKNSPTKHLQNSQNKATLSATYFSTTTKNFQWD